MTSRRAGSPDPAAATGVVPQWTVGDRLRKAREMADLDIQAFATELGVSRNTVHKYEHGDSSPRPLLLRAWALRTGVSAEWLRAGTLPFGPAGQPEEAPAPATLHSDFNRTNPCLSGSAPIIKTWPRLVPAHAA